MVDSLWDTVEVLRDWKSMSELLLSDELGMWRFFMLYKFIQYIVILFDFCFRFGGPNTSMALPCVWVLAIIFIH